MTGKRISPTGGLVRWWLAIAVPACFMGGCSLFGRTQEVKHEIGDVGDVERSVITNTNLTLQEAVPIGAVFIFLAMVAAYVCLIGIVLVIVWSGNRMVRFIVRLSHDRELERIKAQVEKSDG